ncbi:MarR family winged helix-turn-helix transcriptional regulator [Vreelandella alkaliphila]|uniref:MarR family winged helix-turn-helix transcriptional regulator n=1 Tax=Halomonadaceae TaxID=28256 RepID=UPI000E94A3AF|nr:MULTISPECIES: MarR family transcriptional regulator [unclassified Halomonas]HBS83945.1 MarR family transcriptional regulator [Halomonas campaniensis]
MVEHRIGYLIKGVQQAIRHRMDNELRHLNLSTSQYAALSALERSDQLSNAEMARACFVTPQTMQQLVKGLEYEEWIERRSHPDHGRIIQTRLTASGRAVLDQAHCLVEAIEETMVKGLSQPERERLAADLKLCQNNLIQ